MSGALRTPGTLDDRKLRRLESGAGALLRRRRGVRPDLLREMRIELSGVRKKFGSTVVVRDVDLVIPSGKLVTLLGPSGCGKTTILRIIAGLERPDAGTVLTDEVDVTLTPVRARGTGFVFQSYSLFPHMTVFENIAYGLSI